MSVLIKLNAARKAFHASKLTKTGHNKFAGYKYFELGDFLIPALTIFDELNLSAVVSFGVDIASMTLTDLDDGSQFVITSPMSTAQLKACHEVQNLGAVQTYLRRYLWVAALEIVEHDAIDASEGAAPKTKKQATPDGGKPLTGAGDELAKETRDYLAELAIEIDDMQSRGDADEALFKRYEVECLDDDQKKFLWSVLSSKSKSAIKRGGQPVTA